MKAKDGANPERGGCAKVRETAPASKRQRQPELAPGLYVVATPIGNLGDLSPRAEAVLAGVELVLCEDTRTTGRLLHHRGIEARLRPYHEHNAEKQRPGLIEQLVQGACMALVSDAGTPAIADPGFKLVREAHEAGVPVRAVPGPSAVIAALCIAGLATDRFFFQGFLPARAAARRKTLGEIARIPTTLVLYEAPHRLAACLADAAEILGDRAAAIVREATKLHEEVRRGRLNGLVRDLAEAPPPKGEIVVVIGPPEAEAAAMTDEEIEAALLRELEASGPGQAASRLAGMTGLSRRELYRRALALKSA